MNRSNLSIPASIKIVHKLCEYSKSEIGLAKKKHRNLSYLGVKSRKPAIQALLYLVLLTKWAALPKFTKDYTTIEEHILINAISSSRRGYLPLDRRAVV